MVVGVNRFQDDSPAGIEVFRVDPEVEARQRERVGAVRASRSQSAWAAAIGDVEHAARDGRNLVAPILAAVEARATLGEIADAMRGIFGEYVESPQV